MKKCDADRKIRGQKMIKIYSNHVRCKYGANTTETWNEAGMAWGSKIIDLPMNFRSLLPHDLIA
jgi:hypothetical protein